MAQPFMRPQPIVEQNRDARHSASQMNSAVSRITGMSKAVLTPKDELNEQAQQPAPQQQQQQQQYQQQQSQQAVRRHIPGLTQHDWTEADMQEGTGRANQSNRGPESRVYERGNDQARDNEPRDQKMAKKTAKERPYGSKDYDDEEDDLETNQKESRHMGDNSVNESITHVAGLSMEVFREMAGMSPIYDIQESQEYYYAESTGQAAQLPTRQATQYTKMSAGYGQQEGGFAQSMKPKEYGSDGDDSESTLDQAIAMLKKEGLDADYLWSRFLGENNLSIPILEMLCDEAMETGDEAMAEELMQLENAFDVFYESALVDAFGPEVAEGILRKIFGKKKVQNDATPADGAPPKPVSTDMTPAGSGGTSTVDLGARMKQNKPAGDSMKPGSKIQLKPIGDRPSTRTSGGSQLPKRLMPKGPKPDVNLPSMHPRTGKKMGEDRANFECDDDGYGNPRMPWDKQGSLAGLAAKYGGRKNGRTAA
jgi:hypothetical protein